jgi:hypothetical protein
MEAVPHMRKLVLAGGIAVAASLGATGPAYGGGCSTSSSNPPSSVSQYVEQQPTACGNQATGQGGNSTRKVPKQIQSRIQKLGGNDATALTNIVSQQKYGAPTNSIKVKVKVKTVKNGKGSSQSKIVSDSGKRGASASHENPLAASVGVITDGSDGRLIALVVMMLAVAAVVVFSALRRRRVTR